MEKVKWGIIGSGKIARRFADDLKLLGDAVLAGVASRDPTHAAKFAAEFETTSFRSIPDLLTSDADVIYIATPHPNHKEHALAVVGAGKAVLCEKPFAMNVDESRTIVQAAVAKKVFVMEAMWTRFFPAIHEVVDVVRSGKIGRILRIESSFGYESAFNPNSRVFDPHLGGGSLLDVGVYSISLVRMLIDEIPVRIESRAAIGSTGVDESASWTLTFSSGAMATGESAVTKVLPSDALIVGSKGEIRIPKFWCPQEYSINGVSRRFEFAGLGFHFEAGEVMNCLRNGRQESSFIPHQHSLDVMAIMDDIRAQWGLRYPCEISMGVETSTIKDGPDVR